MPYLQRMEQTRPSVRRRIRPVIPRDSREVMGREAPTDYVSPLSMKVAWTKRGSILSLILFTTGLGIWMHSTGSTTVASDGGVILIFFGGLVQPGKKRSGVYDRPLRWAGGTLWPFVRRRRIPSPSYLPHIQQLLPKLIWRKSSVIPA